ncbi:hypothetical protein I350_07032 [Cryptococcus amylolentus CBS 6273]|uniref:Myb/SANT-like domain-containing protein n=1 Tax=Cryptococcus amylolentus CBS 6273 TaxID=1296118 RepID=A0A1E3JHM5_9TREE|nr:hypothetical protein I350_07032 [Cryptococcus amylolentus CBS 6273]
MLEYSKKHWGSVGVRNEQIFACEAHLALKIADFDRDAKSIRKRWDWVKGLYDKLKILLERPGGGRDPETGLVTFPDYVWDDFRHKGDAEVLWHRKNVFRWWDVMQKIRKWQLAVNARGDLFWGPLSDREHSSETGDEGCESEGSEGEAEDSEDEMPGGSEEPPTPPRNQATNNGKNRAVTASNRRSISTPISTYSSLVSRSHVQPAKRKMSSTRDRDARRKRQKEQEEETGSSDEREPLARKTPLITQPKASKMVAPMSRPISHLPTRPSAKEQRLRGDVFNFLERVSQEEGLTLSVDAAASVFVGCMSSPTYWEMLVGAYWYESTHKILLRSLLQILVDEYAPGAQVSQVARAAANEVSKR